MAVVAAILKTGLRIMPHSGGRVGRGIYFASENDKSAGYGKEKLSSSSINDNDNLTTKACVSIYIIDLLTSSLVCPTLLQ